jgi:Ca-activated chloride channel family protein
MSFQQPLFLLGLLLLPLLAMAYAAHEQRRRAGAQAFATGPMLASVAPRRPGWRRHAPLAVYALALAALVVAMARPQTTIAVPVERASIMLTTDLSGSMQATDVAPNRLDAARSAASEFLAKVPRRIRVGLVAFNQNARTLQTPTTDRQAVRDALASIEPSGGTATGEALAVALANLERQRDDRRRMAPGAIVLLTDGASTRGRDPEEVARRARELRVPIYTVALGTPQGTIEAPTPGGGTQTRRVPPDPASLQRIAELSGGRFFEAADAATLSSVYQRLGSRVAQRDEEREVTAAFAGGALLFLAGGAVLSLHWFRRLP